ncbi:hypothetical protein EDB82DRAFT_473593 [Fusarium venenatum]|uniref:uncharacterized protein n=1 Tax=Fusarium venenatum TaxID=56646 RepID=UPI001DFBF060|nr:hypothetical protein EDB82DRAFT_473593 [Fusarium venenatum]
MTKNEFIRIAQGGEVYPTASSGLSTGSIAGIAVGAIAGGVTVAGFFVLLWFQHRKKNGSKLESNPPNSPKPENAWGPEFKPEWTANAPVELPPNNYAAAELPPEPTPIYEMDAMSSKPVEMQGSIPEHIKDGEKKDMSDNLISAKTGRASSIGIWIQANQTIKSIDYGLWAPKFSWSYQPSIERTFVYNSIILAQAFRTKVCVLATTI